MNLSKTELMIITRTANAITKLKNNSVEIERVDAYKYLGTWMNTTQKK